MPEMHLYRISHTRSGFYPFLPVKKIILAQIILFMFIFQGCAFFSSRTKPQFLLTGDDVENIIQNVKRQEDIVTEFYSTGKITVGWILDTSADIFIAGNRDPFMIKMEISHSWGKPLFYFLIREDRLEIRDFLEKKQYTGKVTPNNLSKYLPNMDCSPDMIWSFLRGYPSFFSFTQAYEGAPGKLNIADSNKNILGTIIFSQEKIIKKAVSSPPRFLDMKFTGFRKIKDVDYAEKTVMENIKGKKDLTIKRNKAVFNKKIPDAIFTLKNQPFFETVNLDTGEVLPQ